MKKDLSIVSVPGLLRFRTLAQNAMYIYELTAKIHPTSDGALSFNGVFKTSLFQKIKFIFLKSFSRIKLNLSKKLSCTNSIPSFSIRSLNFIKDRKRLLCWDISLNV